jgi:L-fuculose-phosphate aldolase
VAMTLAGDVKAATTPSTEWAMHAAIYLAYPTAQCIVHTHADACTALACLNEALPAFHYMVANFGGDDVRCAPYVTFGTPELARLAVAALTGRTACLLANHGMIVHAPTPDRALAAATVLETLCRQYLLARSAGTVRLLSADEMRAAHERYRTYGQTGSRG